MSRKIKVNDKEYRYSVGKEGVHINGVGYFKTEEHGKDVEVCCDCCGEPMSVLYPNDPPLTKKAITPAVVHRLIVNNSRV